MVQVYVEPIARRHYAPVFSFAFFYRPLCVGACPPSVPARNPFKRHPRSRRRSVDRRSPAAETRTPRPRP